MTSVAETAESAVASSGFADVTVADQVGEDIDGEAAGDHSGEVSMSADGHRVAIGADGNDGNGEDAGHVRVYDWDGSAWVQAGDDIDGEAADDWSGSRLSMSADGHRVAIGSPINRNDGDREGFEGPGYVRVYDWDGSAWVQAGDDIDGVSSVSMSADGHRVAIGDVAGDGNGPYSGHVRVYDWDGSAWLQAGDDIDGEATQDFSGYSVSVSADGRRVAISARGNDGNGNESGHVRIFDWDGSAWVQAGDDIDGEAADDRSGTSVSMSADGHRIAIGASFNDGNGRHSGHARIYDWDGSAWVQAGDDIDGEAADDLSGGSVSMSVDGRRVAIGAVLNDGNGPSSGHVRVYDWDGSAWVQAGDDVDGEAADDYSGGSVSMSADGRRVAIGASFNNGNGVSSGHVRVYALLTSDPATTTTTSSPTAITVAAPTTIGAPSGTLPVTGSNGSRAIAVLLAAAALAGGIALVTAARRPPPTHDAVRAL